MAEKCGEAAAMPGADVGDRIRQDDPSLAALDRPQGGRRRLLGHYCNSLFVDHAFIRLVYKNMFQLTPQMWRSSQPTPGHIAQAARLGVRTVINLRGRREQCGSWQLEKAACDRHGLTMVDFKITSRDMPKKEALRDARELFRSIQYPALLHCKAGSDRAGFMSVLYLFIHENLPLAEAMGQLHWRFGHVRQAKTGMLDFFFESYAAHAAANPGSDFWQWVDEVYDPAELKSRFMTSWWANTLVDRLLKRE